MTIRSFTFNPFQTNCYVYHGEREAAVVDPSFSTAAEEAEVVRYLEERGLEVRLLLLTHAHIDHIFGCAAFARRYGLPWLLHREELPLFDHADEQARMFGTDLETPLGAHEILAEGSVLSLEDARLEIRLVPGHSPGSICFYDATAGLVISGDVMFAGSVGRSDLWGGSHEVLMQSIRKQLLTLPDDTAVYPGHGPETTIAVERHTNPFLRAFRV